MDYLSDYRKAFQSTRNWSNSERKKEFDDIVGTLRDEISACVLVLGDQATTSEGEAKDAIFHTRRKDCEKALELWKAYSKPA